MKIINYIYMFFFYGFLGYAWEVIWVSLGEKKLTDRGFLYGPILPIYGFGAVFITLFIEHAMERFSSSYLVIFFSGMIIASALELVTGYLIEKIFKVRYWDYTERFMNFKGYICLRSSLFFGVMSIFMITYSNKKIFALTEKIKASAFSFTIYILIPVFIIDIVLSIKDAYGFRYIINSHEKIESYLKEIRKDAELKASVRSLSLQDDLSKLKNNFKERIDQVEIKKSFIENSTKLLEDRLERENLLKEKVKALIDEKIENKDLLFLLNQRVEKVYDKRLKRINRYEKNIERVAKRNDISYKD
ncbi:MAG: hypothetical protein SPI59_00630 [Finegoldia sp.]|nr:hypothetical protein [Finegoldia sp.]